MQGLYTASGDLSLLLKLDSLFGANDQVDFEAPRSQRPPGPIPLPGMAWMVVAFAPWILHWITFDIPGVSRWISVGLPLLLSALIVGYRLAFNRPASLSSKQPTPQSPTLMEWGGLGFFALASLLVLIGNTGFSVWGSVTSSLVMGGLWLGSLLFSRTRSPLSVDYSKWAYIKALWRNSMFIYPNAVISLMWGWQFIFASMLGIAAILLPEQMVIFTVTRYLLLIPAFIFTSVYQKRVLELKVDDYEKNIRPVALLGRDGTIGDLRPAAGRYHARLRCTAHRLDRPCTTGDGGHYRTSETGLLAGAGVHRAGVDLAAGWRDRGRDADGRDDRAPVERGRAGRCGDYRRLGRTDYPPTTCRHLHHRRPHRHDQPRLGGAGPE